MHLDFTVIAQKWELMIRELNTKMGIYGQRQRVQLGTTVTAILCVGDKYLTLHVGDTRLYFLDETTIRQMTTDHTFIAREIKRGTMTLEQAKVDKRQKYAVAMCGSFCAGGTGNAVWKYKKRRIFALFGWFST